MVVNGLHFVLRNERTWHHRFPDQRSPFRAGRVSSSVEGLRTRVSWHAAQDQPKWTHEWEYLSAHPQKREEQPIWQLSRLKIQRGPSVDAGWTCYKLCYNFGVLAAARSVITY